MKKIFYLFPVLTLGLLFACQSKPKTDEQLEEELSIEDIVNENMSGDIHAQNLTMIDSVTVGDKLFRYEIHRISSDSLPTVRGDYSRNAIFYDNVATLKVTQGSRVVYSKTFTKKSFANLVDAEMMKNSILEGFVFDHAIEGGLKFAAAVGYPQDDDMFVPISIKVMADGSVKIERDALNDSASDADIELNNSALSDKDLNNEDEGV
ncbi:MAG: DUF4738 domain-containing protein [Bacteroidales bacterium]|nr:DUF4738 domain-containing protein [Bacteroidales bacterium]